jgi:hypothetical protein
MLLKIFWVVTRRQFLVYDQRFGMGQTSDPETLVIHQKLTPGNKPKNFKQQKYKTWSPLSSLEEVI